MGRYFKAWRRKFGVVTLVIACVFTAAWIRGFYYEDWAIVHFGNAHYLLRSDHGGLSCNKWDRPLPKGLPSQGTQPLSRITVLATRPAPQSDFFVYYSGVAISLGMLSAYLLLSRLPPRAIRSPFSN